MWINKRTPRTDFVRFSPQEARPLQRQFRWKYTTTIVAFVAIAISASIVPVIYFFNENYTIFVQLAYQHSPKLVQYLEQEKEWLNSYLITMALTAIVFCLVFSYHLTTRIIGPILVLQAHIKALTRGNWSIDELNIRDNDEFSELVSNYNYFYYCLRQTTKEDIFKLQNLSIDSQNRNAHSTWCKMIDDKSEQIGLAPITSSASNSPKSHDSRHAS